ncbi:MAG: chorismate-binding protein [Candidatus Zixiibacteriota bacterium]
MRSNSSINITPRQFSNLGIFLSREKGADLFYSSSGYPGYGPGYICLNPCRELIIDKNTCKTDIETFCFSDKNITFGFFSYQLGQIFRDVHITKKSSFPLGHLKKYDAVISFYGEKMTCRGIDESELKTYLASIGTYDSNEGKRINSGLEQPQITSSLSKDEYEDGVKRVIDYIRDGYVYQLNLTIKYSIACGRLIIPDLFRKAWTDYPASFYSLFESGDYHILSTSPERFLRVRDGQVLSQPIKGTLAFDKFDKTMIRQLIESPKESAELSMIVDMVRNDISLNCDYGSVAVENHKSTFVVDKLIQMYSDVRGKLGEEASVIDLLCDAFPGGSITGCPKKMAMELIDELEPHSRDIYCGSMFVIYDEKNIESSVGIRIGYYDKPKSVFNFYAGSGIVVDSNPESEYLETVAKADKFFKIFGK